MVDASSIELFLESIKSASTISRELVGLVRSGAASKKIGEMNAKILEAQGFALSAQADQLSLSKRVSEVEKELMDLKDFRREKKNYQLKSIGGKAFVYAQKDSMETSEPPHWLCSTCCNQDRKSILQFAGRDVINARLHIWKCHLCDSDIRTSYDQHP